jgi:hypothetical protein
VLAAAATRAELAASIDEKRSAQHKLSELLAGSPIRLERGACCVTDPVFDGIAAVLLEHPDVTVRVRCSIMRQAKETVNTIALKLAAVCAVPPLATACATACVEALVRRNVGRERLEAVGVYGSRFEVSILVLAPRISMAARAVQMAALASERAAAAQQMATEVKAAQARGLVPKARLLVKAARASEAAAAAEEAAEEAKEKAEEEEELKKMRKEEEDAKLKLLRKRMSHEGSSLALQGSESTQHLTGRDRARAILKRATSHGTLWASVLTQGVVDKVSGVPDTEPRVSVGAAIAALL